MPNKRKDSGGSLEAEECPYGWTTRELYWLCVLIQQTWQPFTVLLGTGLRIGEALALTWNDIDFDAGIITIYKTMAYKRGEDGGSAGHHGTSQYTHHDGDLRNGYQGEKAGRHQRVEREVQNLVTLAPQGISAFCGIKWDDAYFIPEFIPLDRRFIKIFVEICVTANLKTPWAVRI